MLKKLIAVSAAFAFFACSNKDDDFAGDPSSTSQGGDSSSSSLEASPSSSSQEDSSSSSDPGPDTLSLVIATLNNRASEMFGSAVWPYGYTLKASQKEDLTPFWNDTLVQDSVTGELVPLCPIEGPKDGESRRAPNAACELDKTDAILQNTLSSQYADLNYVIGNVTIAGSFYKAILLKEYKLKADGDQAALGLNVFAGADSEAKNIGELSAIKESLSGITGFSYKYAGGTHEFRAVTKNDEDFWYVEVLKSAATEYDYYEWPETKIGINDFKGMGSFAEDEVPFDISLVAKFLWVVKYDAVATENNTGSLMVHSFNARKPR